MKRNKKQKEQQPVEVVETPRASIGDNCLHCNKPVGLDNANQGYICLPCLVFLDPEYPKNYTKRVGPHAMETMTGEEAQHEA